MPMRVGFINFRRQMLERELKGVMDLLPQLGLEKVILHGDMVTGDYKPDSRIDLIVVQKTGLNYGRRADFFSYHLNTEVAIDSQVYTPEEFEALKDANPTLRRAIQQGRVIFDAGQQ